MISSHPVAIGRRLRQIGGGQDTGTKIVHVREAEDQGRCHESYEDGAGAQESTDQGEIVSVLANILHPKTRGCCRSSLYLWDWWWCSTSQFW